MPQPLESATVFRLFPDSQLEIQPLRYVNDQTLFPEVSGDRLFVLPSDAGSSDSSDGEPTTFVSDDCKEFSLSTGLLVTDLQAQVDGCFSSRLLMADNTRTWSEAGDQQSDSAHCLIVDARLFSTITMSSPQTWLLTGSGVGDSSAQCDSQNGASVNGPHGLILEIVASLDCPVADMNPLSASGGADLQLSPIFRFSIRDAADDRALYAGSFSPLR